MFTQSCTIMEKGMDAPAGYRWSRGLFQRIGRSILFSYFARIDFWYGVRFLQLILRYTANRRPALFINPLSSDPDLWKEKTQRVQPQQEVTDKTYLHTRNANWGMSFRATPLEHGFRTPGRRFLSAGLRILKL